MALLFILKIRYPTNLPITRIIGDRHGGDALNCFRKLEKNLKQRDKLQRDVRYLETCLAYEVLPKFLRIKLYRKSLEGSQICKSWQMELLRKELGLKKNEFRNKCVFVEDLRKDLRVLTGNISAACLYLWLQRKQTTINKYTDNIHENKLNKLGVSPLAMKLDYSKVIFNLSDYKLSNDETRILMLGLEFGLPIVKLDFYKYFTNFEQIIQTINKNKVNKNSNNDFILKLRSIAYKYFYQFKSNENISALFSKKDFGILKKLKANTNIIITKPDKGNGIVILNKNDYINKINNIIHDQSKFCKVNDNEKTLILKLEDKVNNTMRSLKNIVTSNVYELCYASGTRLGYLYGLTKVHKINNPVRPILSACGTHNFGLSKFLVTLISHLSINEYTLKNATEFVNFITSISDADKLYMCSFDIESLYTNIPVNETINIILDNIFLTANFIYNGFSKKSFKTMLDLVFKNSYFKFNDIIYKQLDGLAMGGPISPVAANIFLNYFETSCLSDCPSEFKPLVYKRYLDDTFLLFRSENESKLFFNYINLRHQNIKFTYEGESDNRLSFLDAVVHRENNRFHTSVFRKKTFTGLGLNYFSNIYKNYKFATIMTLINRAYNISSSYEYFVNEVEFLRMYFRNNYFPIKMFDNILRKFLDRKYAIKETVLTVDKLQLYFSLPFIGSQSQNLVTELKALFSEVFPYISPHFYFKNTNKLSSLCNRLQHIEMDLRSSIVYQYKCDCCHQSYIGSTKLQLFIRRSQHFGVSHRTNRVLNKQQKSAIREHSENHNHALKTTNFSILANCNKNNIRIMESLYIYKLKPTLNEQDSALKLSIIV